MITIALDAMGGDGAPRVPVRAALRALRALPCRIVLVGASAQLQQELGRHGWDASRLQICDASQQIGMDEAPVEALRKKPQASVRIAFELLRSGEAQAVVSAGHSGAIMVAGREVLGTLEGILRPALATHLPHSRGQTVLLDSGANVDCKPPLLLEFARMGALYARIVLRVEQPQVALLNIGAEPGKGNVQTRRAHALLSAILPQFIGNLEPGDVFKGRADVIVCDGFAGNLVLKTAEATSTQLRLLSRQRIPASFLARLGHRLMRGFLLDLARRSDYRETGGSLLLGIAGVGIICHGASDVRALSNGIKLAFNCVKEGLVDTLAQEAHLRFGQRLHQNMGHHDSAAAADTADPSL